MPKRLREEQILIAPGIEGFLDQNNVAYVTDIRNSRKLDPSNIDDKIYIYERQIKEWFLDPAAILLNQENTGFIVLMICLSYLEGVEQYRQGRSSDIRAENRISSINCFKSALNRIYPNQFRDDQLRDFYTEARCGLFHDGMVKGMIVINNQYERSIEIDWPDIKVSPSKFLIDITDDFEMYLKELKVNNNLRQNFSRMYSNLDE